MDKRRLDLRSLDRLLSNLITPQSRSYAWLTHISHSPVLALLFTDLFHSCESHLIVLHERFTLLSGIYVEVYERITIRLIL